jgi:hypothetical protein
MPADACLRNRTLTGAATDATIKVALVAGSGTITVDRPSCFIHYVVICKATMSVCPIPLRSGAVDRW